MSRVTGQAELQSTIEIEKLIVINFPKFLIDNNLTIEDLKKGPQFRPYETSKDSVLKQLVAFAGFDIHRSKFNIAIKNQPGSFKHVLSMNANFGSSFDPNFQVVSFYLELQIVLDYFASLGMGVVAEFQDYMNDKWAYEAESDSKNLMIEDFVSIKNSAYQEAKRKSEILDNIASIINLTVEELEELIKSGEFARLVTLSS